MNDMNNAPHAAATASSVSSGGTRIGRVVSTTGAQLIILLDSHLDADVPLEMGGLVSVPSPHATVYGIIEGLSIPMPLPPGEGRELKMAEVGLLGEVADAAIGGTGVFRRGVSKLPTIDAVVSLAGKDQVSMVYSLPRRQPVAIGAVHQNPLVPAWISVDDMLCKHFAVLGTTGSGKSCAVTVILKRILEQNPNGHVLLLDPHGEYGLAFPTTAEHLSVDNFRLPYWLFNFEELTEIIFGRDQHEMAAEIMYLHDLVLAAKLNFAGESRDRNWITVDSPVPWAMGDLVRLLEAAIGSLDNRNNVTAYLRIKARIAALQNDRRYAFLFDLGMAVRDNFAHLLGQLFRIPGEGKPLSILDLASIPSEVLNVVVGVVCRLAFDFAVWAGQRTPLLLICEEAHRYAPQDAGVGFQPAIRDKARIAKEGRKYGISLGVVSQRPSELASTILSQCNTVFAFRMSNERDQDIINATLSEASPALFSALPFLGNSEAIAIGEGVAVPMRLRFADLPAGERPRSRSAAFSENWQMAPDGAEEEELRRVVNAMRGRKAA
jgi:DNA helicase HerA-like ATPase